MSPARHDVSGPMLSFSLGEELALVRTQLAGSTRSARTLVNEGALRVSLVALEADIPHAVRSTNGGVFLLTVIAPAGSSSG